ncbi:MAG TPA: EamA family transporter RarD [Alicycliphilus sp.]|nr:EamA family transporter RarD [Alicycliphilus sp.]
MHAGVIYAALAFVCWGLFPLYFRQLGQVPALEIIMHRTLWSMLFVAALLLVRRQWGWLAALRGQPRMVGVFALSALLLSGNWLIYVWAVNHGHVVDASLGYFIQPLLNVALGTLFLRERPRRGQWVAVALAAAGVAWLTWQAGHLPWIGLSLALTFGVYGLMRKVAVLGALEGLALETALLTPLALAALAWWGWQGEAAWTRADAPLWLWLLAAGPFTAIPLLLFAAGARRITLTTLGVLQYIGPSLQFMIGVWLFGETLDAGRLVGFALIWAALALFTLEGGWQQRRVFKKKSA